MKIYNEVKKIAGKVAQIERLSEQLEKKAFAWRAWIGIMRSLCVVFPKEMDIYLKEIRVLRNMPMIIM